MSMAGGNLMPSTDSQRIEFSSLNARTVTSDFEGGQITSDGGVTSLGEVDRMYRVLERLADCFTDYRDAAYTSLASAARGCFADRGCRARECAIFAACTEDKAGPSEFRDRDTETPAHEGASGAWDRASYYQNGRRILLFEQLANIV